MNVTKQSSFPFFNIARHFGVDYGLVARLADRLDNGHACHGEVPENLRMACIGALVTEQDRRESVGGK